MVTVTTDRASYVNKDRVTITVRVTDGTNAVAGVAVHCVVAPAKGSPTATDGVTNAAGTYTYQYTVNSKTGGTGAYAVTASASKLGYGNGSGRTTFQVTR